MLDMFSRFTKWVSIQAGSPRAFILALLAIFIWLLFGPAYNFSEIWQLIINTATTIITFLMVFLIQNSQNRETLSIQLKLNEIIRAMKGAHTALVDIEELTDEEIKEIHKQYASLADKIEKGIKEGRKDTGTPKIGKINRK